MSTWYPCDESGDVWGLDDAPRVVVSIAELLEQRSKILAQGVKTEPDAETLEVYNRVNAHEQQKLVIDQIDQTLAEIKAVKEQE